MDKILDKFGRWEKILTDEGQEFYHKDCDSFSHEGYCILCGQKIPDKLRLKNNKYKFIGKVNA